MLKVPTFICAFVKYIISISIQTDWQVAKLKRDHLWNSKSFDYVHSSSSQLLFKPCYCDVQKKVCLKCAKIGCGWTEEFNQGLF